MTTPDIGFFRTLADVSEHGLLPTVMRLAVDKDIDAMNHFASLLQERGTTGPFFDQNKFMDLSNPLEPRATFPMAMAHALAPMDKSCGQTPLSGAQRLFFDTIVSVLEGHPNREVLLDALVFGMASLVKDSAAFEDLFTKGIHGLKSERSRLEKYHSFNPLEEAFAHGNTVAAKAWLPTVSDEILKSLIATTSEGKKDGHQFDYTLSNGLSGVIDTQLHTHGGLLEFLDALDSRLGTDDGVPLRLRLMAEYLNDCIKKSTPWCESIIAALAGKDGLDPHTSFLTRFIETHMDDYNAAYQRWPANVLAKAALRAHCDPVLALCGPILCHAVTTNTGINIGLAVDQKDHGINHFDSASNNYPFNPERFKATISVMLAHGHSHHEALIENKKSVPSIHLLAKSSRLDKSVKQLALMEMGVSMHTKDERGWLPVSYIKGESNKEEWLTVERSFLARNKARSVLQEMFDNDDAASAKKSTRPKA